MLLIDPYRFATQELWTPSEITTALWLDAADTSTITVVSGAVSQWNDKSGGGINFVQSTEANRPLSNADSLNSKNVLSFDGLNDNMQAGDALDAIWTGSGFSITWVAKNNAVNTANGSILSKVSSGAQNLREFASALRTSVSQLVAFYTPDALNYTIVDGSTTIANSQWIIGLQAYSNIGSGTANTTSRVALTVNGAEETEIMAGFAGSLSTIQDTGGVLAIGAGVGDGTQNFGNLNGSIAEIIVTPSVPSTTIRQRLEGYLAHKWGLVGDLPAGHPYKSAAPTV